MCENILKENNFKENNFKENTYYNGNISTYYTFDNKLVLTSGNNIDNRYEILYEIGKGAFSDVYLCKDHKNNSNKAIKVMRKNNKNHKYSIRENKLYEKIKNEENICLNIINLDRYFNFNNDIFFVFEEHGESLYKYYKNQNNYIEIKEFSKQILNGIVFLHNLNIIHSDLKPENILIKNNILKIIDLGSSFEEGDIKFNNYIQSRWYRAPEVLFKKEITRKIDVWSYGCIIYELYYRKPLFPCGSSYKMKLKILNITDKVNYFDYMYFPYDIELNSIILLCLKLENRLNSWELIKNNYFN
jgi:dual specificity tyrosine-phosphorylation-regulated kinase 2/3/4